jgi:hypothetical protein
VLTCWTGFVPRFRQAFSLADCALVLSDCLVTGISPAIAGLDGVVMAKNTTRDAAEGCNKNQPPKKTHKQPVFSIN